MLKKLALVVGILFASNAHSEWQVLSSDALPYNAPYIYIVYFSTGEQAYRHRSETAYVRLIKTHKD